MGKSFELVLWKGKKAQMFVGQECFDHRVITTVSLYFPPDQFEQPGWAHGSAVKHPKDGWDTEHAVQLAYKRAWQALLRDRGGEFTKAQWDFVRRARYLAEHPEKAVKAEVSDVERLYQHMKETVMVSVRKNPALNSDQADAMVWALSGSDKPQPTLAEVIESSYHAKYPYLGSEFPGGNRCARNVRILMVDGQERFGFHIFGKWKIFPVDYVPTDWTDVGPKTDEGSVKVEHIARWGEIDDYSKLAEEVSRRNGKGN